MIISQLVLTEWDKKFRGAQYAAIYSQAANPILCMSRPKFYIEVIRAVFNAYL